MQSIVQAIRQQPLLSDDWVNALVAAEGFDEEWMTQAPEPKRLSAKAKAAAVENGQQRLPDMMQAAVAANAPPVAPPLGQGGRLPVTMPSLPPPPPQGHVQMQPPLRVVAKAVPVPPVPLQGPQLVPPIPSSVPPLAAVPGHDGAAGEAVSWNIHLTNSIVLMVLNLGFMREVCVFGGLGLHPYII